MTYSVSFFVTATVALAALQLAPAPARAASVELKGVYANLTVIPEDRADVAVDVRASDGKLPLPRVTRNGGDVVVDGGLGPVHECPGMGPGIDHGVFLHGRGWTPAASAVTIVVHSPRSAKLAADGWILGDVRASQGFDLNTTGCSRWRISDTRGTLTIRQDGAASITAGAARKAVFDLSGVTHLDLASTSDLKVDMSGLGAVDLKSISGPVDATLSGMGNVRIDGGHAGRVKADVSGVGGFRLHGSASELDADVSGIGGVHVDHVDGAVRKNVSGIGHVSVGG